MGRSTGTRSWSTSVTSRGSLVTRPNAASGEVDVGSLGSRRGPVGPSSGLRARGYVRESTVRQGERYGPDAQRRTIERACSELGLEAPSAWYTDLVSATGRVVRDELAAARRAAAAREYDVLVCYDTSRWARNERDAFAFEDEMHRAGVRIYYVAERIWSDDEAEGAAIAKGMFHVLNAQYSRTLRRKIRDGYAAKFATLGLPGGQLPWGYQWGAEAKSIELVPDEAAVRRLVFELYGTGAYSSRSLADELNRRGHRIRGRALSAWSAFEILRNPIAIGVTRRGDDAHQGAAPPLIDRMLWARCQELLRARRAWRGAVRRNVFVFSSRARHAPCDRPLWGHRRSLRGRPERRLVHSSPKCGAAFARNEEHLEWVFQAWLETFRLDAVHRVRLAAFLREDSAGPHVERVREQAERRLERARKLFLLGDIEEPKFLAERREAQRVIDAAVPSRAPVVSDVKALQALAAAWPKASLEARREFVEQLTTEVRFDGDSMELVIRPELRRMVAALAKPTVEVTLGQERDVHGRFVRGSTAVLTPAVVPTSGRYWIRTSDLTDVNRAH